jgi:TRAP-type C4-dicarboxylate transport system permease small subunit
MKTLDTLIFTVEKIFCVAMCSLMLSIVSLEVFWRYCVGTTLMVGIQEIAKWSFVWLATIACAAMVSRQDHIAVEYFIKKFFNRNAQDAIYIITHLLLMLFLISVVVTGFRFAIGQWEMRATSTDIPKTFVYLSIPISMSFMFYHMLVQLITKTRSMRSEKKSEEQ